MKKLTDFEDLISEIKNVELQQFMSEAAACYFAGAYRGVIVISCLALFHDLRHKLKELSLINSDAKTISDEVEKRIRGQELYESYLADQLGSVGICSSLDIALIGRIRDHRNKAAHPSGHNPSAEEARYVYFETIKGFLAKPTLYTTQMADMLLNRLKSDNYFPSNNIGDIQIIVKEELTYLHPGVFPYLLISLRNKLSETTGSEKSNAHFFLVGLSKISCSEETLQSGLQKYLVREKSTESAFGDIILSSISNNPRLMMADEPVVFSRVKALLASRITETGFTESRASLTHPASILAAIASALGVEFLSANLRDETHAYMSRFPYDARTVAVFLDDLALKEEYYALLLGKASSGTFDTSNECAEKIQGIEAVLAPKLTSEESLNLIGAILKAAEGGAWSSQSLRDAHFEALPTIKGAALNHLANMNHDQFDQFADKFVVRSRTIQDFINTYL